MSVQHFEESDSYVEAVYHRIVTLLPVITGLPVTEVEADVFFQNCRSALFDVVDSSYFPLLITSTCDILDDLNTNDHYLRLSERSEMSLRSIAIILRLLSDLCEAKWKVKEPLPLRYLKRQVKSDVLTSVTGIGSSAHRLNYYTTLPDPLPKDVVKRALSVIPRLKSSRETMEKILELQDKKFKAPTNGNQVLLENIDINCLSIIRFLSLANPEETFHFMQGKISVVIGPNSTESDYVPYIDLLGHIQAIYQYMLKYLESYLHAIDKIRKPIHLQLLIYFSAESTKFWLMSTPDVFIKSLKSESSIPLLASSLFDAVSSRLPDFLYGNFTSVFSSLLLVLTPRVFEEYMAGLNPGVKTKTSQSSYSSKQLQYLKLIVKEIKTKGPLVTVYTKCMVMLMFVAGSVRKYDPDSAFVLFSALYSEMMFDVLAMNDVLHVCAGVEPDVLYDVRVEFFVASVTLQPEVYTSRYLAMLKDPNANLQTLKLLTGGLKALSTNPTSRTVFNDMLKECASDLRVLLLKLCNVLKDSDLEFFNSPLSPLAEKSQDESLNLVLKNSKSSSASDSSLNNSKVTSPTSINSPLSERLGGIAAQHTSQNRNNKKDTLSSFRINRHKLDMKKHMSFKLNNNNSSSSSLSTPTFPQGTPQYSSSSINTLKDLSAINTDNTDANTSGNNYHDCYASDASANNGEVNSGLLRSYNKDILKNLFAIFSSQPIVYLLPPGYDVDSLSSVIDDKDQCLNLRNQMESFIAPYVHLYAEDDPDMVELLSHFAFSIVERLSKASTPQLALFYSFASVSIMRSLAGLVSNHILEESKTKKLWTILILFMEARTKAMMDFPESYVKLAHSTHDSNMCRETFRQLEKLLMSGLLIPDVDNFRMLKRGVQLIMQDRSQKHQAECFSEMNVDFYKNIALDKHSLTSWVAVTKKLKRSFFEVVRATEGLKIVWFDLYDKWNNVKSEERRTFLLGFIVLISGVLISPENKDEETRLHAIEKIKFVVDHQINLLLLDDFKTRDAAKETLSTDMHPLCYEYVIDAIVSKTTEVLLKKVASDKDLLFIDQLILIVRLILELDLDLPYAYLLIVEILGATYSWTKVIAKAKDDSIRLKLKLRHAKLCKVIDKLRSKYAYWGLLKHRNMLARVYLEWVESALFKPIEETQVKVISVENESQSKTILLKKVKEIEMLAFDVGVECLSLLATLLERLPLETPQALHEKDLRRSKKVIFGNYFSVLYKILDKFNSTGSVNDSSLSAKHKISSMVESAVLGLSNLLDCNVDVGFEFALPLNFHSDRKIKLSFLKVFINIVNKLEIDNNETDQKHAAVSKAVRLVMQHPQLTLAVASVCPPSDVDSLALTFLNGDDNQMNVLNVLATLIRLEILTAKNSSEILRSNSVATRMLALFCKKEGFSYLERTLKPTLSKIANLNDNFEVEKLSLDDPSGEENLEKLMFYLNEIINLLFKSIEYIPNEFKFLCSVIYEATGKVFPDAKIYAVGAFMFLRFIAPAIVSPDANDIIDVNADRALKRSYIQLAKVLQLMANSSITSIRWPLLISRMNELTILNVQITRYLQAVSKFHPKHDKIRQENNSSPVDESFFHNLLYTHFYKVRSAFLNDPTLTLEEKKPIFSELDEILCESGQPLSSFGYTISDFVNDKQDPNSALYEFMTRTSMKEINSSLRDALVYEAIALDGIPIVVVNYTFLKFTSYEDIELIMFRFYQVASKIWDSKFYVVLDCSGFHGPLEFFQDMFKIFQAYTPPIVFENMTRIFYYNVSQQCYPAISYCLKFMEDHQYKDVFHFASSFDKQSFNYGLSALTLSLEKDVRVTFHDVSLYEPSQNRFVPVTVRIGDQYMQVGFRQPTRFKLFGKMKVITLVDVYPVSDLSSAEISNHTGVPDELSIRNSATGTDLIFTSPKKIEIMRTIYFSKSRSSALQEFQSNEEQEDDINLERWLGQLINIDFVGLLSQDEEVRKASYMLLGSLAKTFKLDLGSHFDSSIQVSFPQSNVTYVILIARVLAEKHKDYTLEIVNGFFNAYKHCEDYQRTSAIMYISPFIRHLSNAIENEKESYRNEKLSSLIKKFIEVSTTENGPLVLFHAHIWSQLTLQDKFAEALIEEAVAASIDREAEGKDWEDIITLVTLTSSLKICSIVVSRLRSLTNIPKVTSSNSIATHTSWIEITVLVKICVALFFNSLLFTEMFMADVLFISTMLMDLGPYELRMSLYKLLLNMFHSALLREDLDEEKREKGAAILNKFNNQRTKLLLGLNRDDSGPSIDTDAGIVNRISALEVLCDSLFEFIGLVGDEETSSVWRSRWHSFAVNAAFQDDSLLQDKAFLILGFLCKYGITDMLISKILEKVIYFIEVLSDKKTFTTVLCAIYALSRVVQGIPPRSPYTEKFYWLAITLNYNDNLLVSHAAIQLLGNALVSVDKRGKFINGEVVEGIFKTRSTFSKSLELYEANFNIKITPENIDLVIISTVIRDVESPFTKGVAVEALCNSFAVRVNNALLKSKISGIPSDGHCFSYAVILYLIARNNEEFIDFLGRSHLNLDDMTEMSEGIMMHPSVLEFLVGSSDIAVLTMVKGAIHCTSDVADETTRFRFLALYKYVAKRSQRVQWMVYPEMQKFLRRMSVTTNSPRVLNLVFETARIAIESIEHYQRISDYREKLKQLLQKHHIEGLKELHFTNINPFKNVAENEEVPIAIDANRVGQILVMIKEILASVIVED